MQASLWRAEGTFGLSFLEVSFLEVSPRLLVRLDTLEQGLEIASAEALMIMTLDYLDKHCGLVLNRFGEDLEQVSLVIIINKNLQLLECCDILCHLNRGA